MTDVDKYGVQQGQLATMLALTIASLHLNQIIDGKELARTFRLNEVGGDNELMVEVANLIDRTILRYERDGPISPHIVE